MEMMGKAMSLSDSYRNKFSLYFYRIITVQIWRTRIQSKELPQCLSIADAFPDVPHFQTSVGEVVFSCDSPCCMVYRPTKLDMSRCLISSGECGKAIIKFKLVFVLGCRTRYYYSSVN